MRGIHTSFWSAKLLQRHIWAISPGKLKDKRLSVRESEQTKKQSLTSKLPFFYSQCWERKFMCYGRRKKGKTSKRTQLAAVICIVFWALSFSAVKNSQISQILIFYFCIIHLLVMSGLSAFWVRKNMYWHLKSVSIHNTINVKTIWIRLVKLKWIKFVFQQNIIWRN